MPSIVVNDSLCITDLVGVLCSIQCKRNTCVNVVVVVALYHFTLWVWCSGAFSKWDFGAQVQVTVPGARCEEVQHEGNAVVSTTKLQGRTHTVL